MLQDLKTTLDISALLKGECSFKQIKDAVDLICLYHDKAQGDLTVSIEGLHATNHIGQNDLSVDKCYKATHDISFRLWAKLLYCLSPLGTRQTTIVISINDRQLNPAIEQYLYILKSIAKKKNLNIFLRVHTPIDTCMRTQDYNFYYSIKDTIGIVDMVLEVSLERDFFFDKERQKWLPLYCATTLAGKLEEFQLTHFDLNITGAYHLSDKAISAHKQEQDCHFLAQEALIQWIAQLQQKSYYSSYTWHNLSKSIHTIALNAPQAHTSYEAPHLSLSELVQESLMRHIWIGLAAVSEHKKTWSLHFCGYGPLGSAIVYENPAIFIIPAVLEALHNEAATSEAVWEQINQAAKKQSIKIAQKLLRYAACMDCSFKNNCLLSGAFGQAPLSQKYSSVKPPHACPTQLISIYQQQYTLLGTGKKAYQLPSALTDMPYLIADYLQQEASSKVAPF